MKIAWLNFVLLLTNQIYLRKQALIKKEGFTAVVAVFILIILEIALSIISLPLYANLRSEKITAFFKEKGEYEKITFDYQLRRSITLTGVGVILSIWVVKLLLIILVPITVGPVQLYSISDVELPDMLTIDQQLIASEVSLQNAQIVPSLIAPQVQEIKKSRGQDYIFYGIGEPNTSIILLLSDLQTAVYIDQVDEEGNWQVEHDDSSFKLSEGNHSVLTFTFDEQTNTRSDFSGEQYFKVQSTLLDSVTKNVDTLANWSVMIIIFVGAFLTFLTL